MEPKITAQPCKKNEDGEGMAVGKSVWNLRASDLYLQ